MDSNNGLATSFDVLIIGAGISGINMAYRIQTKVPQYNYSILEARDAIGGTWDLFRYPGVRSDSDLHTFGFAWQPWKTSQTIADGESIRKYLNECAEDHGIDKKIRFRHKVLSANWLSGYQKWILKVDADGKEMEFAARFVILCTGYHNYDQPLQATIPGLQNFKGKVIHPQFWPADLDYTDKKIVIIGSGATAVSLFPVLAKKASHVTILQRSPTYILAMPAVDKTAMFLRRFLPFNFVARLMRVKFLILPFLFFCFCRAYPTMARSVLRANSKAHLPKSFSADPHFKPKYNPWEQRLCLSPDGDFYAALHRDNTEIVTDTIETITEDKILTTEGKVLEPDIIVTATGLNLQLCGGASITVDNEPVQPNSKLFWRGSMLQDIPNSAFVIGYTNAAWTLGADATAHLVCRILKHMYDNRISTVIPQISDAERANIQVKPTLNLNSTYIENGRKMLPKSGNKLPWSFKRNFFIDRWHASWSDLNNGLKFFNNLKHE